MGVFGPQDIVQLACQQIIARIGNRRQLNDLKDAAQELYDRIGEYLDDHAPVSRPDPLKAAAEAAAEAAAQRARESGEGPRAGPGEGDPTSSAKSAEPADAAAAEVPKNATAAAAATAEQQPTSPQDAPAASQQQDEAVDAGAPIEVSQPAAKGAGDGACSSVEQEAVLTGEGASRAVVQPDTAPSPEQPSGEAGEVEPEPAEEEGAPDHDPETPGSDKAGAAGESLKARSGATTCPEFAFVRSSARAGAAAGEGALADGSAEASSHGEGRSAEGAVMTDQGTLNATLYDDYVPADAPEAEGVVYSASSSPAAAATAAVSGSGGLRVQAPGAVVMEDYVAAAPTLPPPISDRAGCELAHVLRLACAAGRPNLASVALDTVQAMIARGYVQGVVSNLLLDGEAQARSSGSEVASRHARGLSEYPEALDVPSQLLHLVCSYEDYACDEELELAVLRAMLTIVTSTAIVMDGVVFMQPIRACYNIFQMTRSETNQMTARAALTQIVNVVFERLVSGDRVHVRPVTTPEALAASSRLENKREASIAQEIVLKVWGSIVGTEEVPSELLLQIDGRNGSSDAVDARSEVSSSEPSRAGLKSGAPTRSVASLNGLYASDPDQPIEVTDSGSRAPSVCGDATARATPSRGVARRVDCAAKTMRALCKLAMRTSVATRDAVMHRGRVLAMELLAVVLIGHGAHFRAYPQLMAIVKGDLGDCMLANCKSSIPMLQRLTCQIFVAVLKNFREELKTKVSYLFRESILKGLEPCAGEQEVDYEYRVVVLKCLPSMAADGQLLMDLFVNFDCDPQRTDNVLLERTVRALVTAANTPEVLNSLNGTAMTTPQRNMIRHSALNGLSRMLHALYAWHVTLSGSRPAADTSTQGAAVTQQPSGEVNGMHDGAAAGGHSAATNNAATQLMDKKVRKRLRAEGIELFNTKPKKGLAALQRSGIVSAEPADVASFLKTTDGLDYTALGEYLGDPSDECKAVMHAYVDAMDFTGLKFDDAIRTFLLDFRLPGEAQKIDRLMEKFAERYHACNQAKEGYPFANAGVAYVLSYSVIMLNTDQHNPTVKKRMTLDDFVKNNRGINDDADIPRPFLEELYHRIRDQQIMMRHTMIEESAGEGGGERGDIEDAGFVRNIFAMFGRTQELRPEPTKAQIEQLSQFLKEKAQDLAFYSASDPDELRPLLSSLWEYILPMLSKLFTEAHSDQLLWHECLAGLLEAACLMCSLDGAEFQLPAATFVHTLATYTSLHEPSHMRMQNVHALRQLLILPERVGNHLHDNWLVILRCLSRWSYISQVATGSVSDLALFATKEGPVDPNQKHHLQSSWWRVGRRSANAEQSSSGDKPRMMQPGSLLDAGSGFMGDEGNHLPPAGVLDAADDDMLSRVFVTSSTLDATAILEFFQALITVAQEELRATPSPRVFALSRIVDVCHHNMMRPHIVWTVLWKGAASSVGERSVSDWQGLSEFFVDVGCHENLQVAMYAMDALKQISAKFLERPELAAMSFQNDFLKPFVVVMRQSAAQEIRNFIIRLAQRLVLSQVSNIKSGWKSMFMIFSRAAADRDAAVVRLAFDTVEKIVRRHFNVITETDISVFTDCVNCLTAFTNQSHDDNVALNAIAFLRFCASRLASGSIGDVDQLPEELDMDVTRFVEITRFREIGSTSFSAASASSREDSGADAGSSSPTADAALTQRSTSASSSFRFSDHNVDLYFWMPLLCGLTELIFDPRHDVRTSALTVVFHILSEHGTCFSESFWARIFERMLLPIFDYVKMDGGDFVTFGHGHGHYSSGSSAGGDGGSAEEDRDAWIFDTVSKCLKDLISIVVQYYPVVNAQLPNVMMKIKTFMLSKQYSLACVGVAAMQELLSRCGPKISADMWIEVMQNLQQVADSTQPDVAQVLHYPDRYYRGSAEAPTSASASESQQSDGLRTVYSLADGLGARRHNQLRVRRDVQVLLIASCLQIFSQQLTRLPPQAVSLLVDVISSIMRHARALNTDRALRQQLMQWQLEDGLKPSAHSTQPPSGVPVLLGDPPLLQLEVGAAKAQLKMLTHVAMAADDEADARRDACDALSALMRVCCDNLKRFEIIEQVGDAGPKDSQKGTADVAESEEVLAIGSLVVSSLSTMQTLPRDQVQTYLKEVFPLMTRLIRCRSATVEIQIALSNLFATHVGPLM